MAGQFHAPSHPGVLKNVNMNGRGAVRGGKVRTILRAHDGRGPPEGET